MKWSLPRHMLVLLAVLTCAAPVTARAQTVSQLVVSSMQMRIEAGARGQIIIELLDDMSRAIPLDRGGLTVSSADTTIATVTGTGEVTGVRPGRTQILIQAGAFARRVQVSVSAATGARPTAPPTSQPVTPATTAPVTGQPTPVAAGGSTAVSATIEPGNIRLLPSERFRPTFRVVLANGSTTDATDVVWTTFGAAVAIDPATSELVAVLPGSGVLGGRSASSGVTASVPVVVGEPVLVPDPDSLLLSSGIMDTVYLVAPAQDRRRVTQNLTWSSTEPNVLRVLNPSQGIVEARDNGNADLIVTGYTLTRRIPVRVTPRISRIATAVEAGTEITLGVGGSKALEAKAYGMSDDVLPPTVMMWRVADATLASVTATGTIVGVREGKTTVTLVASGLPPRSWPVVVRDVKVSVREKLISVPTGTPRPLTATLRARDQSDLGAATGARWPSTSPAVATVDANGTLNPKTPGRTTVIVSQDGAGTDSIQVFVTGRALVSGSMGGVRGIWQVLSGNDSTAALLLKSDSGAISQAVWSPDRTRIAATFEPLDRSGQSRIVVMDADGRNWKTISPDSIMASDPSWTRDGRSVLMAVRNPKVGMIMRVSVVNGSASSIRQVGEGQLRYPAVGSDTADLLVRVETKDAVDVGRIRAGNVTLLTSGKPREELMATLRDGRLLLAVDSSGRNRPSSLQAGMAGASGVQSATAVSLPGGLVLTDISRGYDDGSVIVVARARSWPGVPNNSLVVLRVPLDGTEPKVLLLLSEKDFVTVRTD